ncbi:hypothetical protein CHLNCDRAFT_138057 [Chlorella variabilis]|uniref:Uncharacterized protein n=1 Tax=Chlorella variabilis TaxID=554065 RepID=E1Z557_CHLVA|nr:hypothetical protein CHLNCDRAFT_138057 [Chlorella variabilis]EFN59466.1 hypothetical protein CHLNCDRAFT_138057 [Chlorella variabilis]|eukprot:XP_005851568.1 hypothetical protein CHLNCDRAFT_138057 [Chlorella variabilis]
MAAGGASAGPLDGSPEPLLVQLADLDLLRSNRDLVAKLQLQLQNPLAVPILGSLAALLFSIVALYSCAVAGQKKKKPAGGTIITEQGLRRSTRAHKPPPRAYTPEKPSPAPVKTPRAVRQPRRRQLPPLAVLLSLLVAAPPEPHGFPLPARSLQKTPKSTKKVETEAVTVTPKATRPRATRAAAKTPATAEPMTTRTRRGAAKTPAK